MWSPSVALLAASPFGGVVVAAVDSSTGGFDPTVLVSSAVTPAIVVLLLLLGKLRTEGEVKRLESESERKDGLIDQKDGQITTLQASLVDKAIPALVRSTLILESLSPLLRTEVTLHRPPRPDG